MYYIKSGTPIRMWLDLEIEGDSSHGYIHVRTSMVWCVLLDVPTPPQPNAAQLALYSI